MYNKNELKEIASRQQYIYVVEIYTGEVQPFPTNKIDFNSYSRSAIIDIPEFQEIKIFDTMDKALDYRMKILQNRISDLEDEISDLKIELRKLFFRDTDIESLVE